jgi:putative transposase
MPNHVHSILAPSDETGLGRVVGEAHRRTTNFINARGRWIGHLFQSRFSSVAMDESHLIAAVRYVSLNPVRARLARKAEDSAWSSVRAHLTREDDEFVSIAAVLNRVDRFAALLESDSDDGAFRALRSSEASGRPLGNADFKRLLGRPVARRTPGPKSKRAAAEQLDLLK